MENYFELRTSELINGAYKQLKKDSRIYRLFSDDTSTDALVWHEDAKDRHVRVLYVDDYAFQFDDKLPRSLKVGDVLTINKGVFHRLIRYRGELIVCIRE